MAATSNDSYTKFAASLVGTFFSGMVTPRTLLDQFCASTGDSAAAAELRKLLDEMWARGNQSRSAGGKIPLDPLKPLLYSRGFGEAVDEEEFRHYLPEEKILINQTIFRKKLEKVDFSSLDGSRERGLVEELQRESIGLTRDDTVLYFNLLKVDFLARKGEKVAPKQTESPADAAIRIIKLVEQHFFLDRDSLAKLNGGRTIDMAMVNHIVTVGIHTQRINARLLVPYLSESSKFVEKFKEFIKLVVDQRDGNSTEVLQSLGLYLLLNGTAPEELATLQLSSPLETFITDRIGRVRQIYYVAMLFGYSLTFVLFAQAFELHAKYNEMPADQKAKLRKLYEAEDRLAMLVSNAVNVATRRIAEYGVEAREIQTILKKFLAANKKLITGTDLFSGVSQ